MLQHIYGIIWIIRRQQIYFPEHFKGIDQGHYGHKKNCGRQIPYFYVKEYLERRTEVLINARTIQERQDALHFWSAVSQSKQAHDIVFNKLAQIDKKPPQAYGA